MRTSAPFLILGLAFLSGCSFRARTDAHPADEDHEHGREEASWSLADFSDGDDARRGEALEKLQQVRASTRNCANLLATAAAENHDPFSVGSCTRTESCSGNFPRVLHSLRSLVASAVATLGESFPCMNDFSRVTQRSCTRILRSLRCG